MRGQTNPDAFTRLWIALARDGLSVLLLRLIAASIERISRQRVRAFLYHFVAQPVQRAPLAANSGRGSVDVEQAGPAHPLVHRFPRPNPVITERFRNRALCFVARKADKFAGFLWLQSGDYMEDEVRCIYVLEPPNLAVWDFDVYVEPAFRYGRTFARLWDAAHAYLRGKGYRWTLSRISIFNRESIRAHERLGAQRICSALFIAGKRCQVSLFTVPPYFHAGGPGSAPRLRLIEQLPEDPS